MFTEPDTTKQKEKKEDSFFDYEAILPQDRIFQEPETKKPDVSVSPEPSNTRTPNKIIDEIFSCRPPAPTYDKNRPEELKRLARASAIGKGVNLLGDVISLGAGGNVVRRQPDNRELSYLQSMYDYIDKRNIQEDEYNWRDYVQKLRTGELALSEANRRKERELRKKMQESEFAQREEEAKKEREWRAEEAEKERKWKTGEAEEERKIDWEKLKIDKDYKNRIATASEIRAVRSEKSTTDTKTYNLYNSIGNAIPIDDDERMKIIALILEDPLSKITKEDVALLQAKFGTPMSTNTINTLIQKYWEKTPEAKEYVYSKYGQPQKSGKEPEKTDVKQKWGQYAR
jgi:hypothetical protein